MNGLSVVIPVYNEGQSIGSVVRGVSSRMAMEAIPYEIIVVDDGSTDETSIVLSGLNIDKVTFVSHPYNIGYGSALKSGVDAASMDTICFFDADGQHDPEDIIKLIKQVAVYAMVVGAREGYKGPVWRQPGKRLILWIAEYLVGSKIPDINSGLRLCSKMTFNKFRHLYPRGFSLSTTITLACLKSGLSVGYVPIHINKREGRSTVRISDGFKTINLVLRMIMLFSPMKVFLPISMLSLVVGIISLWIDISRTNIGDTTVLLFISAIIIFSFGLIADQLAAIRRSSVNN